MYKSCIGQSLLKKKRGGDKYGCSMISLKKNWKI